MKVFRSSRFLKFNKLIPLCPKSCYKPAISSFGTINSSISSQNVTEHVTLSNGTVMTLSTGEFARLADGSAVVSYGNTSVLVTAVASSKSGTGDFQGVPLIVDYRQKAAAAGRIPTNFLRRELGVTEKEILTGRVIDRSLRPLFAPGWNRETQLICNLLATDGINNPDVLAINAASAALSVSGIPWNGPIAAVRIGLINDKLLLNPTRKKMKESILNLIITSTLNSAVVMIEGSAEFVKFLPLKDAIEFGVKEGQSIIQAIQCLKKKRGKHEITIEQSPESTDDISELPIWQSVKKELEAVYTCYDYDKITRDNALQDIRKKVREQITRDDPSSNVFSVDKIFSKLSKETMRSFVLDSEKRCDGRGLEDIRNINCKAGLFKPLHGSAMFQRGQTQVMCTVTLDSPASALKMDTVSMLTSDIKERNFFLHYEFPPFATNDTGKTGIGRREIGHGALAEKGIQPIIPRDYEFTIRLTSEVFESNGSSSMATICGGSLALMDAGVPITKPVAGVAMGLITKSDNHNKILEHKILTDILGIEDYMGDMDFKMAGTKDAFTALQADIKLPGVPIAVIISCIERGSAAIKKILETMDKEIKVPRTNKTGMPVCENIEVPVQSRRSFLGVGGTNLKKILLQTGVQIYAQEETTYSIFAPNSDAMQEAKEIICKLLNADQEPVLEFGAVYAGTIVEIRSAGVMVKLYPTMTPTLLHNSQLDQRRVHHPSALGLEVGQKINIKYFGRDPFSGQMRLSRKVLQEPSSVVKSLT